MVATERDAIPDRWGTARAGAGAGAAAAAVLAPLAAMALARWPS